MRTSMALLSVTLLLGQARGAETDQEQRAVTRALEWLAAQQYDDGHWEPRAREKNPARPQGSERNSITALAALALLTEGSTLQKGKYAAHLERTVNYIVKHARRDGLLPGDDETRYMFAHSYNMLFLSQVLDVEGPGARRRDIERALAKAVEFSAQAQVPAGGWGYVSAFEGNNFDEGCVSAAQIRALYAVHAAGIAVPREVMQKAEAYLTRATTKNGGVVYTLAGQRALAGMERPAITVADLACLIDAGKHDGPLVKQWLIYSQRALPMDQLQRRLGFDEYIHHHYAEALYRLGDRRTRALLGDIKQPITWSAYRKVLVPHILGKQAANGSWTGPTIGPVYATTMYLSVLQLESSKLPLHQPIH